MVLAALALIGAIYFYMIHLAVAAMGFCIAVLLCLALAAFIKGKMNS